MTQLSDDDKERVRQWCIQTLPLVLSTMNNKKGCGDVPDIIGLSGKMRSGKTWLANKLAEQCGFAPLSFATPLKEDLRQLGFTYHDLYVDKAEPIRLLMQKYGQAMRYKDPDHWLNRGIAQVDKIRRLQPNCVVVFDDVRFPNEADRIREMGGIVVRVVRQDRLEMDHFGIEPHTDISETALDAYTFDAVLRAGSGELAFLADEMDEVLKQRGVI
jgi:hypothetical protein